MCNISCDCVLTGDVIYASQKRMPLRLPRLATLCYVGGFHFNGFHSIILGSVFLAIWCTFMGKLTTFEFITNVGVSSVLCL